MKSYSAAKKRPSAKPTAPLKRPKPAKAGVTGVGAHDVRPDRRAVGRVARVERAVLAARDDELARAAEAVVRLDEQRAVQEAEVVVVRLRLARAADERAVGGVRAVDRLDRRAGAELLGRLHARFQIVAPVAASSLKIESESPIDGKV